MVRGVRQNLRPAIAAAAAMAAVALLAGCSDPVEGTAQTGGEVAGLPVTHFESGPKEGVEDADLKVENGDGGDMDQLAVNSLADLGEFWGEQLKSRFGEEFKPASRLVSYDAEGTPIKVCNASTEGMVNAFYCPLDHSIAWDRGTLLPMLTKQFGPMGPVTVLAHEMGHAVQFQLGKKSNVDQSTPTIVTEQQADCYAGGFFRWVAEGHSEHFRLSTGDGLNRILGAMFMLRDPSGYDFTEQQAHGTAFDRVFAFQAGFTQGVQRCAKMDEREIQERITERAFHPDDENQGNVKVDEPVDGEKPLDLLKKSLDKAFEETGAQPPEFSEGGSECPSGTSTDPVSYCEGDNTVALDIPKLNELATPPARGDRGMSGDSGIGDFAAFGEIASRYAVSVQEAAGADLESANAGLRTACLTGSWAGYASARDDSGPRKQLLLSSGDLDEAIAEMLSPRSLIAADAEGKTNAPGFAMVEAFRTGYADGTGSCTEKYR